MEDLVEELAPFTSDFLAEGTSIIDDDDLKEWGIYSDESLLDRYRAAKEHVQRASPAIPGREKPKSPTKQQPKNDQSEETG